MMTIKKLSKIHIWKKIYSVVKKSILEEVIVSRTSSIKYCRRMSTCLLARNKIPAKRTRVRRLAQCFPQPKVSSHFSFSGGKMPRKFPFFAVHYSATKKVIISRTNTFFFYQCLYKFCTRFGITYITLF